MAQWLRIPDFYPWYENKNETTTTTKWEATLKGKGLGKGVKGLDTRRGIMEATSASVCHCPVSGMEVEQGHGKT